MNNTFPRLMSDIGGTHARFSIELSLNKFDLSQTYNCVDYPDLPAAINYYIQQKKMQDKIHSACIVVPAPIIDDTINMVNNPWKKASMQQTIKEIQIPNTIFINDFHALALAIPFLPDSDLIQLGGEPTPKPNSAKVIIGPGTGLGTSILINNPLGGYLSIASEGGRISFGPGNEEEIELWQFAHKRYQHVSVERFLCGSGLQFIYEGLCVINKCVIDQIPSPQQITQNGIQGTDFMAQRTLEIFCRLLGGVAANLVVTVNAFGGVYIGGGIIPRMLEFFMNSSFRGRFEAKGRYHWYLAKIPAFVIVNKFPAFLGASYALNTYLNHNYIP